ncbi:MAG: hypothetical protein ABFS86_19735, partial [Planctomycetota bacterium]
AGVRVPSGGSVRTVRVVDVSWSMGDVPVPGLDQQHDRSERRPRTRDTAPATQNQYQQDEGGASADENGQVDLDQFGLRRDAFFAPKPHSTRL